MTFNILWAPLRWDSLKHIETESVGDNCTAVLGQSLESITDEQWSNADALVALKDVPEPYRSKARNCKIFVTPKVGYDNIDIQAWGKRGIPVCNVPDYGTMEVADHAMALILSVTRSVVFHNNELRADVVGNHRPALNPYGRRLSTCTLGIVGLGRIGMATALRAKAFNMEVVFYDPYVENGRDKALGVTRVESLHAIMQQSDVISLHCPLNNETQGMINAASLAQCQPHAVLVNTARGPIIDLNALHDVLKNDGLLAAALDVLPQEPADPAHPLIKAWIANEPWIKHRLILTPHSAFYTPESFADMRGGGGRIAALYLESGRLENCVNTEYLTG